jgi:hypothetical protein
MYLELNGLLEATCQDADRLNRTALNVKLGHDDFFLDRCLCGFSVFNRSAPARGLWEQRVARAERGLRKQRVEEAEGCESRERVAGAEG